MMRSGRRPKVQAKIAGLEVKRIINEPTAAALAYGFEEAGQRVAVYDLGGGTFDISVLELSDGVFGLLDQWGHVSGWEDFDFVLVEHLVEEFQRPKMST